MSVNRQHPCEQTRYGFTWGPAKYERRSVYEGQTCLGVTTDYRRLEVYVSPRGRSVRVWLDGVEMKRGKA